MIRELVLPQLSMGMSEGTIAEWACAEGAYVEKEALLLLIETEKVVSELPSPYRGYLHIGVPVGETVPIESVIGKMADTEEEYRQLVAGAQTPTVGTAVPASQPPRGQTSPVAVPADEAACRRIAVSGLAKKIARERGVDLAAVVGTGPRGRIVRRDVLAASERTAVVVSAAPAPGVAAAVDGNRVRARVPMTGMRKTIAERMVQAKTNSASIYLFFEADVTKLVAARETLRARENELETRMSLTAIYAKALALAVQQVPICNSTLVDSEIVVWDNVNVGIAVALPGKGEYDSGLVVPVVRDVERKGLLAIDREIKDLAARARAGKLTAADMAHGTVTLSSSAGFFPGGWMVGTPLLNLPQVVNFQPGSIVHKPVVHEGQIVSRPILPCGLTVDHRAMDGEPAGRLARTIADLLVNPELMLL